MTRRRVTSPGSSPAGVEAPLAAKSTDCILWTTCEALPRLWATLPACVVLHAAPPGSLTAWSLPETASAAAEIPLAAGQAPAIWQVPVSTNPSWRPAPLARGGRPLSSAAEQTLQQFLADFAPSSRERIALEAGIRLLHEDLEGSHRCSQQLEGLMPDHTGDYWHAIMHRREPDASNSKYWFRHVGRHPVFPDLLREAQTVADSLSGRDRTQLDFASTRNWDPGAFVDACSRAVQESPQVRGALEEIQFREMCLLLRHTWALLPPAGRS